MRTSHQVAGILFAEHFFLAGPIYETTTEIQTTTKETTITVETTQSQTTTPSTTSIPITNHSSTVDVNINSVAPISSSAPLNGIGPLSQRPEDYSPPFGGKPLTTTTATKSGGGSTERRGINSSSNSVTPSSTIIQDLTTDNLDSNFRYSTTVTDQTTTTSDHVISDSNGEITNEVSSDSDMDSTTTTAESTTKYESTPRPTEHEEVSTERSTTLTSDSTGTLVNSKNSTDLSTIYVNLSSNGTADATTNASTTNTSSETVVTSEITIELDTTDNGPEHTTEAISKSGSDDPKSTPSEPNTVVRDITTEGGTNNIHLNKITTEVPHASPEFTNNELSTTTEVPVSPNNADILNELTSTFVSDKLSTLTLPDVSIYVQKHNISPTSRQIHISHCRVIFLSIFILDFMHLSQLSQKCFSYKYTP